MNCNVKATAYVSVLLAVSTAAKGSQGEHAADSQSRVLTLSEAQRLAVQHNPSSRNLDEMVHQADMQVRVAWSMLLPHLDARASATRNQHEIILDFPDFSAFDPANPAAHLPTNQTVIQEKWGQAFGLRANMTVFDLRSIPLLRNAGDNARLSRLTAKRRRNDLLHAVATAYYQAYAMREMIDVARENLMLAEELVRLSKQRITAGQGTKIDVLRAELQANDAHHEWKNARDASVLAKSALGQLIGREGEFEVVEPGDTRAVEGDLDALTDRALDGRVELQESALAETMAERKKTDAWMSWLPAFDVTYDWSWNSAEGFSGNHDQWMLIFGARWSLFDGGARIADLALNDSKTRMARNNVEQVGLDIRAEVERAFLEVSKRRRNVELDEKQVVLAAEKQKLVDDQYRVGLSTSLDAMEATTELHSQRVARVLNRLWQDIALLNLAKTVGEYNSLASHSPVD